MGSRAATSTPVEIPGPAGVLEGAVDANGERTVAVAVLCHPHPQHQGTMHNKVVTTLARTFSRLGAAAVRFNFRGVGESAGAYAGGAGERDDASAVVAWARERWPGQRVYLGGFSFGAAIALAIADPSHASGLVTVAPPIDRLPPEVVLPGCPWLLVHGGADDVVPAAPVIDWARSLAVPPRIALLDGVGHFFHGRLADLAETTTDFFAADFGARQ